MIVSDFLSESNRHCVAAGSCAATVGKASRTLHRV